MLPLVLITLYRMYPALKCKVKEDSDNTFVNILKQIGVLSNQVKYKDSRFSVLGIYFTSLFSLYLFISLHQSN